MTRPQRRTPAIKTMTSVLRAQGRSNERHVHQFQLAALELEQVRRTRERKAAFDRVREVDARLVKIEALIQEHHRSLGLRVEPGAANAHPPVAAAAPRRRVLRYGSPAR